MDNTAVNKISKTVFNQLDIVTVNSGGGKEYYITATPASPAKPFSIFEDLIDFAKQNNARIVSQQVFGGFGLLATGIETMKSLIGEVNWPMMWLRGDGCSGPNLAGTIVFAVSDKLFKPLEMNGETIGAVYEDSDAEYCVLGNIRPDDIAVSREVQARGVFEKIESALESAGMDFSNVVRSWLYLDHILDWYDEFNQVRNTFFEQRGIYNGTMPASTGIGAANSSKSALTADIIAVKAKNPEMLIEDVPSPLQCSAADYKSSFSRALELSLGDYRKIFVSGTASIAPSGQTVHIGDTGKQIVLTMEVVDAILKSRKMGWADVSRAIAYFRDISEKPLFDDYCRKNSIPGFPVVATHCHVCRDDLLFELELDALVAV